MKSRTKGIKILERICKKVDIQTQNIFEALLKLSMSDLQSLLIHVFKNIATMKRAPQILKEYGEKRQFFGPSSFNQPQLLNFLQACYQTIPKSVEILELSPVAPLGINAVLSRVSQNNILSTIRCSEVISDTTTQLALECAWRRRQLYGDIVHLCSTQRVLRMQPFDVSKGYMQHFDLFGMCTGGIFADRESFMTTWIKFHISIIIDILEHLKHRGYSFYDISVNISDINFIEYLIQSLCLPRAEINRNSLNDDFDLFDTYSVNFPKEIDTISMIAVQDFKNCGLVDKRPHFARLENAIIVPLKEKYPHVKFCFDFNRKAGLGYYEHLCFHIYANNTEGNKVQIADGGAVNWLYKLLMRKEEYMVISGIGSELVHKLFL